MFLIASQIGLPSGTGKTGEALQNWLNWYKLFHQELDQLVGDLLRFRRKLASDLSPAPHVLILL